MTNELVETRVLRDTYRDSVELMRVAAEVERLAGMRRSALLMGTPANLDLLAKAGLLDASAAGARPSDLVVAVAAETAAGEQAALAQALGLLATAPSAVAAPAERRPPATIAAALDELPGANLAIVSTPGPYARGSAG